MNNFINSANWEKSYPIILGIIVGFFFFYHKISFEKNVFILSADISAVLFGFALTFMGFLISASDKEYLQKTRKYKERYSRLLRFSQEAVYGCLGAMTMSLIAIIDRFHNFIFKYLEFHLFEIIWSFIITYAIFSMFRIFRISIFILVNIE